MKNPDEQDIIERLEQLGAIQPDEKATARAIERARRELSQSTISKSPIRRRLTMTIRVAAGIAALAGMVTLATWLLPTAAGPSVAFAQMQKKLEQVKSVSFTIINRTTDQPERKTFTKILDGTLSRVELPNGEIQIFDNKRGRMLRLFPQEKRAELTTGLDPKGTRNALEQLRNISKQKTSGKLPDKQIDGKIAKGFVVEERGQKVHVWIDPWTKLPVRIEMTNTTSRDALGGLLKKKVEIHEIFTDFVYDAEIDKSLFDTTPPADYVVNRIEIPKRTPEQRKNDAELVIRPKIGFGPAKFGMSLDEVVQHLGKPDQIKDQVLDYRSRGFTISIDPNVGFRRIAFQKHPEYAPIGRTFQGKTDKGIGIDSTREEIEKAYGPPNYEQSNEAGDGETTLTTLAYFDLGLNFTLRNDNLVTMSVFVPREK